MYDDRADEDDALGPSNASYTDAGRLCSYVNPFQISALVALAVSTTALLTVVCLYARGEVWTSWGGVRVAPPPGQTYHTISSSITGTNIPIITAILPVYAFFRGVQLVGEVWETFDY
jgi:hypothetical protein